MTSKAYLNSLKISLRWKYGWLSMTFQMWLIERRLIWLLRLLSGGLDVAGNLLASVMLSHIDRKLVIQGLDHVRCATTLNVKTPVIVIAIPPAADHRTQQLRLKVIACCGFRGRGHIW